MLDPYTIMLVFFKDDIGYISIYYTHPFHPHFTTLKLHVWWSNLKPLSLIWLLVLSYDSLIASHENLFFDAKMLVLNMDGDGIINYIILLFHK
jgi:hypothetical protein